MSLGVAFCWHTLAWEELLALVRRAESLGYAAAYVDGDVSMLSRRREAEVLDGWTVTSALLVLTQRIPIGSIRLVHHWNAGRLAQAVSTADRIAPGRLRFLVSIGDRPEDDRFGLPALSPGERVAWLDETLTALRGLWRGDGVTLSGRHVQLEEARVRPVPSGGRIPIEIAARRPRMLELVAAHADVWNVNLPALPGPVAAAAGRLERACARLGRDPEQIARSLWIFTRAGGDADVEAALPEFRRLNPWFREIPDAEAVRALLVGAGDSCRARLEELRETLDLDLPVLDLSGLDAPRARETLEALAPACGAEAAPPAGGPTGPSAGSPSAPERDAV